MAARPSRQRFFSHRWYLRCPDLPGRRPRRCHQGTASASLVAEGWLAHKFAGERMLPPMQKLLGAPFWLDPSEENVWDKAVHRVATDGVSPEQAVDEAMARLKLIE